MSEALRARYDRASDVLYISTLRYGPAYGEEDAPGLIWEYRDDDGTLVGVTVTDYSTYWRQRSAELLAQMMSHFHVSEANARQALDVASG
jgi:hypothetical protein